jgi:hypothetical protein
VGVVVVVVVDIDGVTYNTIDVGVVVVVVVDIDGVTYNTIDVGVVVVVDIVNMMKIIYIMFNYIIYYVNIT